MPKRMCAVVLSVTLALTLAATAATAAEPVKRIGIAVEPYYAAARTADAAPRVAVGASFDTLLASNRRDDLLAARDKVKADPRLVTPMTLMVLAIRLYDVGLRDDAVFWFYVAKDRYVAFAEVVDIEAARLGEVDAAVKAFATLAGPAINSYAFCDVANQQRLRREALAFVEANPYAPMFMDRLPARSGDRRARLGLALAGIKAGVDKERDYFADAKNAAAFAETRRRNEAEARFCWK